MKLPFCPLLVVSALLSLAGCDKSAPPAAVAPVSAEADNQLAEARDALQRQALEIETKTALMDKQLAEMQQSLKDHENAELRGSLDALKQQNDDLRTQAEAMRQKSVAIAQRIAVTPQPNVAPQSLAQADYSLFYERLAPLGRWFEVNGYGYCWQPAMAVAGWRPYLDGCWVWSSLGWAWQSNEPFGWATYHYGRWVNLASYGWVWVPGSEWAPAWVAWRQSRDCVGWAPLPPEPGVCSGVYRDCDSRYGLGPTSYTFIAINQFVSPSYVNVYAPVTQQNTIFQHSVNVTQIVPRSGHGHSFVQQGGPPRAQMEQACGRPVPQRQVQAVHAAQLPEQPHGGRDAIAPVAMVQLPAVAPGARPMHPDIREHIQRPVPLGGFEGVPQHVATEIRENIAQERKTAAVQQPSEQHSPMQGHTPHAPARHPVEAPGITHAVPMTNAPAQESMRPAVAAESGSGAEREHRHHPQPVAGTPPASVVVPARVENRAAEPSAPAVVTDPPAVMQQPASEPVVSQPPAVEKMTAEQASANAAAEAEKARMHAAREQAHAERQQQEMQERAMAEKRAAEQAASAEAEKARMQAAAAQQEAQAAQQQRMAATETEKTRQQAEAATAQQQQDMTAQQQRATAERMAVEQAAAAEVERARQQTAAAAMQQRQQEEATRRAAEEQQMRAQQETERRTQEMAQRQAEEQTRRQQEAEMQRTHEQARRAAEEQQMRGQQEAAQRAQEMAQRQAEEQARRAQEQAQRQAEEQARRSQEEAQRAAVEAARNQPKPAGS